MAGTPPHCIQTWTWPSVFRLLTDLGDASMVLRTGSRLDKNGLLLESLCFPSKKLIAENKQV